jgi:gliding motility-associated-like protein
MKKILSLVMLVTSLIISTNSFHASHLIGGNLGYEYIGQFGNLYRYKIILTTYTDCTPASQIQDPEPSIQPIGIYQHNVQNNPMGGANKTFITSVNLNLINPGGTLITPNLPGGCSVGAGSCIKKGIYEGFVDLALSFNGYHIFYERCCRNAAITNLVPNESMSFHAYIPSSLIPNNSPKFTNDPIPFLCAGETTSILNSAYDIDGDLLTFSFVTPYDGFSNATNPAPGPPNPTLNWTLPTVTYATGFSTALPFGAAGASTINATTGLTTYTPTAAGNYVVAVEIREFRNGNLIGVTRSDLQLLVLNCPVNPAPVLSTSQGTTVTQHTIEEGSTLCFDFGYDDPNNNSTVTLVSTGAIFNALFVNPPATINTPVTGSGDVSTEFCWTTACGQAQSIPYQFQTSASDNGCPPKTANNVFQITVSPVAPPTAITGTQVSCQNGTQTYSTNLIAGATYNWSISGGTIVSQNNNSVTVQWTNIGSNMLSVSATNQFGCNSAPIDLEVVVASSPTVNAGNDTELCIGNSVVLSGSTTANPGFTSSWTPIGIVSGGTTLTPTVAPTTTTDYVLTINIGNGCLATDTVQVTVNDPQVNAGNDVNICTSITTQLNGTATAGTITWSPSATLSDPSVLNPIASPNTTTTYTLQLVDAFGCTDTDDVTVNVEPIVILSTSNDTTICEGDCINLFVNGSTTYVWSPSAGLNSTTSATPTACPIATTTFQVIGFNNFCTDTAFITVTVSPTLAANAGNDVAICIGENTQLNGSGGIDYSWTPAATLSDATISNPVATPTITTTYVLSLTDALGCSATDSVIVTVNPLPTVSAGEDKGICISATNGTTPPTETLNGSGVGTPLWTPATGLSADNILNPIFSPLVDTEYVLTLTDVNGCVNSDTTFVTIFGVVPTNAGADTTICPGESVTLGGNPSSFGANTIYLWSPAAFLNDATLANPIATPTVTTMFYLVTNNDTCNGLDSVLVTVNPLPLINAGSDVNICVGDDTQLQASGGVSYVWESSTTLSSLVIDNPFANPTVTTEYIVEGTDALGCTNTDTVEVTVNSLPLIDAGSPQSICINNSANLLATGGVSYTWTPSATLNDNTIADPTATPTVTTTYVVVGIDANTCQNSDSVEITVNPLPTITITGANAICIGDNTSLTAAGGVSYIWNTDATLSSEVIANPIATPTVTTTYTVTGTDANGCENTATFSVTVNNLPIISAGTDSTICLDESTGLLASGGTSYVWNANPSLSSTTVANPTATPLVTTIYTVIGTDANGCENSDNVSVFVNTLPTVDAGTPTAICIGASTQLQALGAISYTWLPATTLDNASIDNPVATPTVSTTYTVTGTDGNGCTNADEVLVTVNNLPNVSAGNDVAICIGNTTPLEASGAVNYTWSPATDLSNTAIANPVSSTTSTITYSVLGVDANGCENTDDVVVTVNPLPTIDAGTSTAICIGASTTLTATGGVSYVWSPAINLSSSTIDNPIANPTSTQVYMVSGTDANGCFNTDNVTVTVNNLPTVSAGNDINICLGDVTGLIATGATNYVWSPVDFLDNVNTANPNSTPDTTIQYTVVGTDGNGCISSDSVIVNVFRITTVPDQTICIEDSVQLNVFGSPGNAFVWTPATGLTNPNISNPIATPLITTTYTISATDLAGCQDQDEVTITVNPKPQALLNYDIIVACDGGYVNFENQSVDAVSYLWNFGNGDTSTLENPTYTYGFSGTYGGTLTVTNQFGCIDQTTYSLTTLGFNDYFDIYIPNVFTPNGDGENDVYRVEVPGRIAECVTLSIYNRWGQLMFISTGNNIIWDGFTSAGIEVPNGTYFYTIEVSDKSFNGTISLFR